ncbi:unnamed protein product, partial [Mesorhabditis spiculigera]
MERRMEKPALGLQLEIDTPEEEDYVDEGLRAIKNKEKQLLEERRQKAERAEKQENVVTTRKPDSSSPQSFHSALAHCKNIFASRENASNGYFSRVSSASSPSSAHCKSDVSFLYRFTGTVPRSTLRPFLTIFASSSTTKRRLVENRHRPITPFDLHATLLDLLGLKAVEEQQRKGQSLLEAIPKSRGCVEAQIPLHHCTCQTPRMLRGEELAGIEKAGLAILLHTLDYRCAEEDCGFLKAAKVVSVEWRTPNEDFLSYSGVVSNSTETPVFNAKRRPVEGFLDIQIRLPGARITALLYLNVVTRRASIDVAGIRGRIDSSSADKFLGCFVWSEFDGMAAMDAYNVLPEAQGLGVGRGLWDYTMVRSVPPHLTRAMRAIPEHVERYMKLGWPHRGPVQYEMYCSPVELKATCSSGLAMCQASGSGEFVEIQRLEQKGRKALLRLDTMVDFLKGGILLECDGEASAMCLLIPTVGDRDWRLAPVFGRSLGATLRLLKDVIDSANLPPSARLHVHFTDTTSGFYTIHPLLEKCTQRPREFYATTLYDRPYRNPVDTDLIYVIHDNFLHFDM